MFRYRHFAATLGFAFVLFTGASAPADVRLPHLFSDHMVLQRAVPVPVWGWANPGENVTVSLNRHTATAQTDAKGAWRVTLPALQAGGPHTLIVRGNNTVTIHDVLVGEVWLCSGQSNMEMGVGAAMNAEKEIAAANFPRIRLFELPLTSAGEPAPDVNANWRVCSPDTIAAGNWGGFSAIGYYFGRELHRELDVPVGLIDSCWGGTRISPWTPPCGFTAVPAVAHYAEEARQKDTEYKQQELPRKLKELEDWIAATRTALAAGERLPDTPHWPRHPLDNQWQPTGLYNAMIHPLIPFALRGAIWYQGEANVYPCDGMLYYEKMKALIGGWRKRWQQGDFPFYFVQLAPFKYTLHRADIKTNQLPRIWDAQFASLAIPNTGMAVTTDLGDWRDIHPRNKQEVGRRLALWALAKNYGHDNLVYSGPLYRQMKIEGNRIRLQFDCIGGGLKSRDGKPLNWFHIAGDDQTFVAAQAEIDGGTIVVSSPSVPHPVAVRFAWHMLPEPIPNLVNAEGLPASPFRTDDWPFDEPTDDSEKK